MRHLCFYVVILFAFSVAAQSPKIDSLKAEASTNNNAEAYYELFKTYRTGDSAVFFLQKALTYVKDKKLESNIRRGFGAIYLNKGFYSVAQKESFDALKLALEVRDSLLISSAYLTLGRTAFSSYLYDKALQFYEEGLKYTRKNELMHSALKNNCGLVLMQINDLYKATGIFQELVQTTRDSLQLSAYHNNLGDVFLKLKNYDSAYNHISATLNISLGLGDSSRIMFNKKLMGQYYYGVKQDSKAKSFFLFALRLNDKYNEALSLWNFRELPELYQCMTDIYTREHDIDSLLWLKNKEIEFQKDLLVKHRKNSGEVVFGAHEGELNQLMQRQNQARRNQIEYYGIAFVLLFSVVIYFVFSGRDKQQKYAPYISIVILILVFEFFLVVLEPLISEISGNDPLYSFLCNVALAFLIVPLQFLGEKVMKKFSIDIKLRRRES